MGFTCLKVDWWLLLITVDTKVRMIEGEDDCDVRVQCVSLEWNAAHQSGKSWESMENVRATLTLDSQCLKSLPCSVICEVLGRLVLEYYHSWT